jgi:ribosomal-protein-alanine N-acetyltransferase
MIQVRPPECFATARLRLRPMRATDAANIFRYASDAKATRFMIFRRHEAIAESEVFARRCETCWRDGNAFPWAIFLAETGEFVGCIEMRINPPKADLGYILCCDHWRRGFATEAVSCVVGLGAGAAPNFPCLGHVPSRQSHLSSRARKIGTHL